MVDIDKSLLRSIYSLFLERFVFIIFFQKIIIIETLRLDSIPFLYSFVFGDFYHSNGILSSVLINPMKDNND